MKKRVRQALNSVRGNSMHEVYTQATPTFINTATTTVVVTGQGTLVNIIINGGTTGTITIYDNTAASGTKIADFDTTNSIASIPFGSKFAKGLTVVTSAATKLTVNTLSN